MNFALERIADPDIEPITLLEAKRHVRAFLDLTNDDADIDQLITVAREWVEDYTGRALIDQSWRLHIGDYIDLNWWRSQWPGRQGSFFWYGTLRERTQGIFLRRSPAIAITSVVTVDSNGVETTVSADDYQLREQGTKWPRILGLDGTWPCGSMKIEFRAGYANRLGSPTEGEEKVPAAFKHAIKLIVGHFYNHRESTTDVKIDELPLGVKALLRSHRCDLQLA